MAVTLLQFDFPAAGPWGEAMAGAFADLAHAIADASGLLWKIWTENEATGEQGASTSLPTLGRPRRTA